MPPVTLTQLAAFLRVMDLKRDYVDNDEISPAAKLAAMASEDQLFPDHGGFDWKSIRKKYAKQTRKRKKVPVPAQAQ